jgi:hypothetical protein
MNSTPGSSIRANPSAVSETPLNNSRIRAMIRIDASFQFFKEVRENCIISYFNAKNSRPWQEK